MEHEDAAAGGTAAEAEMAEAQAAEHAAVDGTPLGMQGAAPANGAAAPELIAAQVEEQAPPGAADSAADHGWVHPDGAVDVRAEGAAACESIGNSPLVDYFSVAAQQHTSGPMAETRVHLGSVGADFKEIRASNALCMFGKLDIKTCMQSMLSQMRRLIKHVSAKFRQLVYSGYGQSTGSLHGCN